MKAHDELRCRMMVLLQPFPEGGPGWKEDRSHKLKYIGLVTAKLCFLFSAEGITVLNAYAYNFVLDLAAAASLREMKDLRFLVFS